mmetsp:Transcript_6358/g.19217  ORF Transcript_6358/g.19217 Transcript_6358/m.19217 type:complete len:200 (-) Transcript_6358:94-693(-)
MRGTLLAAWAFALWALTTAMELAIPKQGRLCIAERSRAGEVLAFQAARDDGAMLGIYVRDEEGRTLYSNHKAANVSLRLVPRRSEELHVCLQGEAGAAVTLEFESRKERLDSVQMQGLADRINGTYALLDQLDRSVRLKEHSRRQQQVLLRLSGRIRWFGVGKPLFVLLLCGTHILSVKTVVHRVKRRHVLLPKVRHIS